MHSITLIIPGLLLPPTAISTKDLPDCKNLQRLLSRADSNQLQQGACSYLFSQFGYADHASPPYAALSYLADSGETRSHVMRADPVHLSASREGMVLLDNTMLRLQADEAKSLAAVIQPLLNEMSAELVVKHAARWYLLCEQLPPISTWSLMQVVGRDISNKLPAGQEQTRWRQLFNEIQMLLHETPVNQARERRGHLPVNSLWFWGEGELTSSVSCAYDVCVSNDPVVQGLARQQQIPVQVMPQDANELLDQLKNYRNALIVDERARYFRAYEDAVGWLDYIAGLEQDWIQPLQQALLGNHVKELRLVTGNYEFICHRRQLLRFWRRRSVATQLLCPQYPDTSGP